MQTTKEQPKPAPFNVLRPSNWGPTYIEKHRATKSAGRVINFFTNVDFRLGHDGLAKLSKQNAVDVAKLNNGQYIVFVNSAKDRVKVFAANNVIAYLKLPHGRKVDSRVIQEIPSAFQGNGTLDYDKALKAAVEKALARRNRKKQAPS